MEDSLPREKDYLTFSPFFKSISAVLVIYIMFVANGDGDALRIFARRNSSNSIQLCFCHHSHRNHSYKTKNFLFYCCCRKRNMEDSLPREKDFRKMEDSEGLLLVDFPPTRESLIVSGSDETPSSEHTSTQLLSKLAKFKMLIKERKEKYRSKDGLYVSFPKNMKKKKMKRRHTGDEFSFFNDEDIMDSDMSALEAFREQSRCSYSNVENVAINTSHKELQQVGDIVQRRRSSQWVVSEIATRRSFSGFRTCAKRASGVFHSFEDGDEGFIEKYAKAIFFVDLAR